METDALSRAFRSQERLCRPAQDRRNPARLPLFLLTTDSGPFHLARIETRHQGQTPRLGREQRRRPDRVQVDDAEQQQSELVCVWGKGRGGDGEWRRGREEEAACVLPLALLQSKSLNVRPQQGSPHSSAPSRTNARSRPRSRPPTPRPPTPASSASGSAKPPSPSGHSRGSKSTTRRPTGLRAGWAQPGSKGGSRRST